MMRSFFCYGAKKPCRIDIRKKTMHTLPIYYAEIDFDDEGIQFVSLVDYPAVESNFVAFSKQERQDVRFAMVEDGDQHLLVGVVMRADFPIYRCDECLGEYYIVYRKDTIRRMAEKMLYDGRTSAVNVMHTPVCVNGVNLQELFIKDTAKGIAPEGFEDIEDGSLFATYKVHNHEVWSAIKRGEFKGFSLEGLFQVKEADPDAEVENLLRELEEMEKTINNFTNN